MALYLLFIDSRTSLCRTATDLWMDCCSEAAELCIFIMLEKLLLRSSCAWSLLLLPFWVSLKEMGAQMPKNIATTRPRPFTVQSRQNSTKVGPGGVLEVFETMTMGEIEDAVVFVARSGLYNSREARGTGIYCEWFVPGVPDDVYFVKKSSRGEKNENKVQG